MNELLINALITLSGAVYLVIGFFLWASLAWTLGIPRVTTLKHRVLVTGWFIGWFFFWPIGLLIIIISALTHFGRDK